MGPDGYRITVTYLGTQYGFNTLRMTDSTRTEDTNLADGGLYRVKAGATAEIVYLKARIKHSEIFTYRTLLRQLAAGASSVVINGVSFTGMTLLSGKVSSEEGMPFAVCEMTLTEVRST